MMAVFERSTQIHFGLAIFKPQVILHKIDNEMQTISLFVINSVAVNCL
jgi:hypothetical protein